MFTLSVTRVGSIVSWAAALQLAIGLILGGTALFLITPGPYTEQYPLFFGAIFVPGAVLVLGKSLLVRSPRLAITLLVTAAGFDSVCFHKHTVDLSPGSVICLSLQSIGILVLVTLGIWWLRRRPV